MIKKYLLLLVGSLLFSAAFGVKAQILVVPDCLLGKNFKTQVLGKFKDLQLIEMSNLEDFQHERLKHPIECRGFIDVTANYSAKETVPNFLQNYLPKEDIQNFSSGFKIHHHEAVYEAFKLVNQNNLQTHLESLTDFPDRSVYSKYGKEAEHWLKEQIKDLIADSGRTDVQLFFIPTPNENQQSLVVKIGQQSGSGILVGAHFDTPRKARKSQPGADDNASGVVTLLESLRILLAQKAHYAKPLYFVWYAGQEAGLLGSQSVVRYFNKQSLPIEAVLGLDEVGYLGSEPGIGLTDDFTDAGLTAFVADLVVTYLKLPVGAVRCGFACSDHVSWHQNGNRVVYPFTTMSDEGNPNIHTYKDTLKTLSLPHIADFVKLTLAFMIELGS